MAEFDYTLYDVTVSVLTPLHIGSGRNLLNQYDYAIYRGQTWRINEDALLDAQDVDDPRLAERLMSVTPASLLQVPADYRADAPHFRYVLKGTPRSGAPGAQLREQIKDAFDRPYLPGSSVKGALRTALLWHALTESKQPIRANELGTRREWAAQRIEQRLLGKDPNHDALRALHVGDSNALDAAALMIANVRVHHRNDHMGSPIEAEAIRSDSKFSLTLKLDNALYSDWAQRQRLNLAGRDWLDNLAQVTQAHAQERIRRELDWFGKIKGASRVAGFYQQLANLKLPGKRFLLQLGWGTGWGDKTFGSHIEDDKPLLERVVEDYRLARGKRQRGEPFPKSRRLVVSVGRDGAPDMPVAPLGWCLVEMKERK